MSKYQFRHEFPKSSEQRHQEENAARSHGNAAEVGTPMTITEALEKVFSWLLRADDVDTSDEGRPKG